MDPRLTQVLGFSTALTAQSGQPSTEPIPERSPADYRWLQEALAANRPKDEPTQMKELLAVAVNPEVDAEDRIVALEDFQMLIEHPYNAGNIKKMNMWEPLINLLEDPSEAIQRTTLSVFGSAIQNDEGTRGDFDKYNLLPRVLEYLKPREAGSSAKAKSTAISCLIQALKHNRAGVEQLQPLDLWNILATSLSDVDLKVRKSVAWMYYVLLLGDGFDEQSHRTTTDLARQGIATSGSLPRLVEELKRSGEEAGYREEAAAAVLGYLRAGGEASRSELSPLSSTITQYGDGKDWQATKEEWDTLLQRASQ